MRSASETALLKTSQGFVLEKYCLPGTVSNDCATLHPDSSEWTVMWASTGVPVVLQHAEYDAISLNLYVKIIPKGVSFQKYR